MRLREKFGLFAGLIVLLATVASSIVSFLQQKRLIETHLAESRAAQSVGFAAVCRQALTVDNELFMVNYVKLLQESPRISYAYFVDAEGKILIHSDRRFFYKPVSSWSRPSGTLEVATPVALGHQKAGTSVIGFSESYERTLLQNALARTLKQASAAAAAVAVLGLAAAAFFAFLLTRPLKALSQGSERIAKGDFRTEVAVSSRDELGELAERFNAMARSLAVLDEMKDEFISNVSHDLRNPMAAIKMYADYLLYEEPNRDKIIATHRDILITIADSAKRLGFYVNNVLNAAKIKAGRMEYHLQPMELEVLAQGVQALFGIVAGKARVHLVADIPVKLPPLWADPELFEQVIANLVSNAIKFTPREGRIVLGGREKDGRIEVFVSDTGRGIPAEDLPKLFQRFVQSEVAEQKAKRIQGTGLGLYIVRRTVDGMGGTVRVESELGKGTRFTISMPKPPQGAAAQKPAGAEATESA